MPNAADLSPSAVRIPDAELRSGTFLESATEPLQAIRCIIPSEGGAYSTRPLGGWQPLVAPAGFFYPKAGDRAQIGFPRDGGVPMILAWEPSASSPDAPLP